jgi:DNA-binding transcriptional ArsR family regulator
VNAFDVLGDPVRRRILELLAQEQLASGGVVTVIADEFGISQPAVSQHLRILRESGFATVRPEGARRLYSLDTAGIDAVEQWLSGIRASWEQRLDALETEIARGKRERRLLTASDPPGCGRGTGRAGDRGAR